MIRGLYSAPVENVYCGMGKRIDDLQCRDNVSLTQMAKDMGMGRTTLLCIKTRNEGQLRSICKIADYFHVTLDYLVYGKEA